MKMSVFYVECYKDGLDMCSPPLLLVNLAFVPKNRARIFLCLFSFLGKRNKMYGRD